MSDLFWFAVTIGSIGGVLWAAGGHAFRRMRKGLPVLPWRRRSPRYDIPNSYRRGAQMVQKPPTSGAVIPAGLYAKPTAQSIGIKPSDDFVPPTMSLDALDDDREMVTIGKATVIHWACGRSFTAETSEETLKWLTAHRCEPLIQGDLTWE